MPTREADPLNIPVRGREKVKLEPRDIPWYVEIMDIISAGE
jgi:hypothetical protein